jgi:hypothetical protein
MTPHRSHVVQRLVAAAVGAGLVLLSAASSARAQTIPLSPQIPDCAVTSTYPQLPLLVTVGTENPGHAAADFSAGICTDLIDSGDFAGVPNDVDWATVGYRHVCRVMSGLGTLSIEVYRLEGYPASALVANEACARGESSTIYYVR